MIKITIDTGNAAFADRGAEVGWMLRSLAQRFEAGGPSSPDLRDHNGNAVGTVEDDGPDLEDETEE